jgi:hypothetical protein
MTDTPSDDQLFRQLAEALAEADPAPPDVLEAAKGSFTWRTVDAELAELAFDSAVQEVAGVRGAEGDRHLLFRTADMEIEIAFELDTRYLRGQLAPVVAATIELRTGDDTRAVDANETGGFEFADVPSGPLQLRITAGESVVSTEWTLF